MASVLTRLVWRAFAYVLLIFNVNIAAAIMVFCYYRLNPLSSPLDTLH